MALGSTQPLVKMSTKDVPGGKGGWCVRLTTYHHIEPMSRNLGTLNLLDPSGPAWPVMGVLYHDIFYSRLTLGYAAKFTVNTTGCTLGNCVPIGLQTINATGRGSFIVPTNYEPPFCGKFIPKHR
jgi:hypothetical protein